MPTTCLPNRAASLSAAERGAPHSVTVTVGEKGLARRRLLIRGIPGHGSAPWGSSNAGVIAAEAVTRLTRFAPRAVIGDYWPRYVEALDLDPDVSRRLTSVAEILGALPALGELAGYAHATTHTTISPNVIRAGDAINVIPGEAEYRPRHQAAARGISRGR